MNGSDRGYDGKPRLDAYFWDTPRLEIDLTKRVALSILRLYTALRIPLNLMEQKGSVKGGYNLRPIFLCDRFEDCLLAKADGGWELQTQPPRYDTRTL